MHVTNKRHFHVTESFINRSIRLISSRTSLTLCCTNGVLHWSHWPRGIKQGSSVLRLLGLGLWIPPGTWMSVSCKCCVFSGRGLCVGLIFRPEESYRVSCVRMRSWKLENAKAVAHSGLSRQGGGGGSRVNWGYRKKPHGPFDWRHSRVHSLCLVMWTILLEPLLLITIHETFCS